MARLKELDLFRSALDETLQDSAVIDTLGNSQLSVLGTPLSRVTLAELTENGSIELWVGAGTNAIAVLPVLRGERSELWNVGDTITHTLSAAGRAAMADSDLRSAADPDDDADPFSPDGRLHHKEYASLCFPVKPHMVQ
ncbi:MAG TPA: hypothetical protein VF572_01840 [Candidatus Saccharimonadales bacterium]